MSAVPAVTHISGASSARILRLFVSYAQEDAKIAIAVSNALQEALGDTLAEVFLDKTSIEPGLEWRAQIEDRLETTDILVVVFTGVEKPSHSYSGWEVGFFQGVQTSERRIGGGSRKKAVALYLNVPPATTNAIQGISFGITRETLEMTEEEFARQLRIDERHPLVKFVDELEDVVADIRREGGYPRGNAFDTVGCVRRLLMAVFSHLKTTVDKVLKPQKQINIRTTLDSLAKADGNLPPDAELVPVGAGNPMSIFGLPEEPLSWGSFLQHTADHEMGVPWREAINGVILNQVDVDNSQIIFSADNVPRLFRLILTTSTTFFDGKQEFSIYLVETLRPTDFGNLDMTLLLKGLGMACRYRFKFLERNSEFHSNNILALPVDRLPSIGRRIIRELNLLMRDAREAGLDQPNIWANFVEWDLIKQMSEKWAPRESRLRKVVGKVIGHAGSTEELEAHRGQLAETLSDLERSIDENNRMLIEQMSDKLKSFVGTPRP
jgi:hypothetical protein